MIVASHAGARLSAEKLAMVVGSSSSDEAKIGGMTPDGVELQRQERGLPLIHAVADLALRDS